MKPTQIIIIGGGKSIQKGIMLGLKDQLQNRFVIACNYSFKHFPHTILTFVDSGFYQPNSHELTNKIYPDITEDLKKEPLILGFDSNNLHKTKYENTILFQGTGNYKTDISDGIIFHPFLCGVYSLTIAQWLLDFKGEIFLLGYDWTKTKETHYYSDIKHRGIGATPYLKHDANNFFKYYNESNIKIYNVSPYSHINNFEKIDYFQMFTLLKEEHNQDELRDYIKDKIQGVKHV